MICTLNICGIKDKDPDIVEFMKKWKIPVLGISDCHLKGNGTKQLQDNNVLTWSGVSMQERAIHEVAFVMQPNRVNKGLETDIDSGRIVKTRLKYEHRNETKPSCRSMHYATTPTRKRTKQSFLRNYLAQLAQYQTTIISLSWEAPMEG